MCGSSEAHCSPKKGCQLAYGTCSLEIVAKPQVSTDGKCGNGSGITCKESPFGNCCSKYGACGSSPLYCSRNAGCQEDSGICVEAGGAEMEVISIDGRCGYEVSRTCLGSRWGDCCSGYGWCGRKENHCDVNYGCQSGFGTCG